jgi:hypothetical protein
LESQPCFTLGFTRTKAIKREQGSLAVAIVAIVVIAGRFPQDASLPLRIAREQQPCQSTMTKFFPPLTALASRTRQGLASATTTSAAGADAKAGGFAAKATTSFKTLAKTVLGLSTLTASKTDEKATSEKVTSTVVDMSNMKVRVSVRHTSKEHLEMCACV